MSDFPAATTKSLQLRFVLMSSVVLGLLSLVAAVVHPVVVRFDVFYFAGSLGAAFGFAGTYLLARRGKLAASSNLLLAVATLGLAVGVTREAVTSTHHLLFLGFLVPVMAAFLLDRLWVGVSLVGFTLILLSAHAARFAHPPEEIMTLVVVFVAGSSLSAVDLGLRARERMRADAQETESDRLRELNEMRMQFINTAAHDLRTPLTPLKLALATLRRGSEETDQPRIQLMERSVTRFELLIEDMLDAARLQAGRLTLKRASVNFDVLVREALESFRDPARKGDLLLDASGVQPARIDADALKASQVILNLVSNAIKYTPAGGKVFVSLQARPHEALLVVQDTGLGMSAEQMSHLFQPFVRLHEGQPGVAKGTGLGLYISKGIMEAHGGRLTVQSDGPGKGSQFTAAWPLATSPGRVPP